MLKRFRASILGWSCFPAPQGLLEDTSSCDAALSADGLALDFIPSSLRRRCSTLTKVTLAVAHAAASSKVDLRSVPTVFASAHGESEITAALLHELAGELPLSPMGFSLSVHNAASGLFSIATGNTGASTAIAAGDRSFLMGLCEALLLLADKPETPVLYVCSDEQVPEVFLHGDHSGDRPFAVALLMSGSGTPGGCEVLIDITPADSGGDSEPRSPSTAATAIQFVSWLGDQTTAVQLCDEGAAWRFEALSSRASLFVSPLRN